MKIRLNLATKALETHRRFLAGAGLTAVVAGLLFLGLGWHVYSARKVDYALRARTEKMRQEMAKLEAQRKELERYFSQKDIANLHDRAAFINTILDARSFNWTLMFMDLEHNTRVHGAMHDVSESTITTTVVAGADNGPSGRMRGIDEETAEGALLRGH